MAQQHKDQNQIYYEDYYRFPERSRWMEKIWSEAFVDAYPQGLEHYGYLTLNDLEVIAKNLQLEPGSTFLDIGCGKGGPGLKLAEELKLKLIGIDIVADAVRQAEGFQEQFDLAYPAEFREGNFYEIPLEDDSVEAVISIDSLWAATHKILALREVKRVLKPGGKFIFTHWDLLANDQAYLLEVASGLTLVSREETPGWKGYQEKVYAGILKYQAELVEEMGEGANMLLHEAQTSPAYLDQSIRRIYHWELK